MKEVKTNKSGINLISLISNIRENFGDDNLFFTFLVIYEDDTEVSTFASDNMDDIDMWLKVMMGKFHSGNVSSIVLVMRRFLNGDKASIEKTVDDKKINIPMKELYQLAIGKNKCILYNEQEVFEFLNMDSNTDEKLEPEQDLIYMSSIKLIDELYDNKYDLDNILDKINLFGEENISSFEKKFLETQT